MAAIQQTFAPFETETLLPKEASFAGLAKESIIVGRTVGVMVRPASGTNYDITNAAGQSINVSINSSRFVDFSKLRMLANVQVLDVAGAASAQNNRMILESGLSLIQNAKVAVSGVETDNVQFAAACANALTVLSGHTDYHKSQGQLNGNYITSTEDDFTTSGYYDASGYIQSFDNLGKNMGPMFAAGVPIAVDLSFLSILGMSKLYPSMFGRVDIQLILNSGVQSTVRIGSAISPLSSVTLTNVRFTYDEVDLNPTYVKALTAYMSNPANSITLPCNSYQVQRVNLPAASQVSNTIAIARKYVKTIITTQRNANQSNSYPAGSQGYPRWTRHSVFGRYSEQVQCAGLYYPTTLHQDRADLLAYTLANTNALGDALGAGSKLNPWSYGVFYTETDGGSTVLGTEKDLIAPSVALANAPGKGRKLVNQIVVHNLEANAQAEDPSVLDGLDLGSLGATISINSYYDGGSTTTPPVSAQGSGEMYCLVEFGQMLKLQGRRVSVVSV